MLAAFCVVDPFVAEEAKRRMAAGGRRSERNITDERNPMPTRDCGEGNLPVAQFLVSPSSGANIRIGPNHRFCRTVETQLPKQFLNVLLEFSLVHNSGMR